MSDQLVEKLENLLNQYDISNQEKDDIINDYKQMIEDGKQKELSEQTIIEMIGNPEKITRELGFKKKDVVPGGEKWIALSPFISLIIFMILGFTKELWHPGWLVFLLIPVTAIIVEMSKDQDQYILTALSPFISFVFFFLVGYHYGIWHPTWMIFIIIPTLAIINSKKEMDNLTFYTALSPFVSFIAFMLIGYYTGEYHLAWLLLLSVAFLGIFHEKRVLHKLLLVLSLVISILLYLTIDIYYGNWTLALFAFTIFIVTGLLTGHIHIEVDGFNNKSDILIVFIPIILFLGVGYIFSIWAISWLFLLLIPVVMIIKYRENNRILTPLSPFIAVTTLVLLGYFCDLWHISWTALLIIPIVAIIENA